MKKIVLLLVSFLLTVNVYAVSVKYDGFNVTEENHVKVLPGLYLKDSEYTITGADAEYVHIGQSTATNGAYSVYYYGPLEFGTGKGSNAHLNHINATIKIRFKDKVALYDGGTADLILTLSDIEVNATKNSRTSTDGNYFLTFIRNVTGTLQFYSDVPKVAIPSVNLNQLSSEEQKEYSSSGVIGNSYKTNVQVVESGTNTPIDSKYVRMAFGARDLDVRDCTVDTSTYDTPEEGLLAAYLGKYAEGIEFTSGLLSDIHLANNTPQGSNITEQSVVTYKNNSVHGGLKIVSNGVKLTDEAIRPNKLDDSTYYSGFVTMVDPRSFEFYWTGSNCGSVLFLSQDVDVTETHNKEGIVTTSTYGEDVVLGYKEVTPHPMGSKPVYNYTPAPGYHVIGLKVNGETKTIASDYRYQFSTLIYNPLVRLDSEGLRLYDDDGNTISLQTPYTIDIKYAPNNYTIVYEDGGGTDGVAKMPDQTAIYGEKVTSSKNDYAKKGYTFINWVVFVEDAEGTRAKLYNADKSDYTLANQAVIKDIVVSEGGKLVLVAQWEKNEYVIEYSSGAAKDDPTKMPPDTITNTASIDTKENKFVNEGYTFANWKVYLIDEDGNKTELLDKNNKPLLINDKDTLKDIEIPVGSKVLLEAQWVANPKTGAESILWILSIAVISYGGYYLAKKKNYFNKI